jgi:hypothetical protein
VIAIAALKAAVVGAVVSVAVGAATGQIHSWKDVGRFAATGAVTGAILGVGGHLIQTTWKLAGTAKVLAEATLATTAGTIGAGLDSEMQGGSFRDGTGPGALGGLLGYGIALGLGRVFRLPDTQPSPGGVGHQVTFIQQMRQLLNKTGLGTRDTHGGTIDVFRVEGSSNARILIDGGGNVSIPDTNRMLFLNFGQPARASEFLTKKVAERLPGATIKSFKVPERFLYGLRGQAVPEAFASQFPGRPLIVDATRAPDQFGLRSGQIRELLGNIIQGSGKIEQ